MPSFCSQCGAAVSAPADREARYCRECGSPLLEGSGNRLDASPKGVDVRGEGTRTAWGSRPATSRNRRWPFLIAAAAGVVVAAGLVVWHGQAPGSRGVAGGAAPIATDTQTTPVVAQLGGLQDNFVVDRLQQDSARDADACSRLLGLAMASNFEAVSDPRRGLLCRAKDSGVEVSVQATVTFQQDWEALYPGTAAALQDLSRDRTVTSGQTRLIYVPDTSGADCYVVFGDNTQEGDIIAIKNAIKRRLDDPATQV